MEGRRGRKEGRQGKKPHNVKVHSDHMVVFTYLVKVQQCEGELGGRAGAMLHGSDQEDGEVLWSPLSPLQVCGVLGKFGCANTIVPYIKYLVYQWCLHTSTELQFLCPFSFN